MTREEELELRVRALSQALAEMSRKFGELYADNLVLSATLRDLSAKLDELMKLKEVTGATSSHNPVVDTER